VSSNLYFEQSFQVNSPLRRTKRHLPLRSPPAIPVKSNEHRYINMYCSRHQQSHIYCPTFNILCKGRTLLPKPLYFSRTGWL